MAKKKKLDPKLQQWIENFNRKPTAAEETDFYRRNAGGPMVMTSLTRGRGFSGVFGDHDDHVGAYRARQLAQRLDRAEAEERRTYYDAHICAWGRAVYWPDWQAQQQHTQHAEHCVARFYHLHLHPHHRPAWRLNPFLIDP
jgi:hypothetical protein